LARPLQPQRGVRVFLFVVALACVGAATLECFQRAACARLFASEAAAASPRVLEDTPEGVISRAPVRVRGLWPWALLRLLNAYARARFRAVEEGSGPGRARLPAAFSNHALSLEPRLRTRRSPP